MASASPRASAAVVLEVGTRFQGHASSGTLASIATSAAVPSVDAVDPVMAISRGLYKLARQQANRRKA